MKSIMLEAFDSMLLEELGITRDNLSDVQVDIRKEMINEAMFYMTGIIKVYKPKSTSLHIYNNSSIS